MAARFATLADGVILSQTTFFGVAPSANAGPDRTAECVQGRATFQLSAAASSDGGGDSLRYRWIAPSAVLVADANDVETTVCAPLGRHELTLEISHGMTTSRDRSSRSRWWRPVRSAQAHCW